MFSKTHKKILFLISGLCLILIVASVFIRFISPISVTADTTKYYGGEITKVTYCTCYYDFGVMLEIKNKLMNKSTEQIKIFYNPLTSKLRAYYNIWKSGPQVLGAYIPDNHQCKMTKSYYCTTEDTTKGTIDSIKGIGTTSK